MHTEQAQLAVASKTETDEENSTRGPYAVCIHGRHIGLSIGSTMCVSVRKYACFERRQIVFNSVCIKYWICDYFRFHSNCVGRFMFSNPFLFSIQFICTHWLVFASDRGSSRSAISQSFRAFAWFAARPFLSGFPIDEIFKMLMRCVYVCLLLVHFQLWLFIFVLHQSQS